MQGNSGRVAVSFSYNGYHVKSIDGTRTCTLDPIEHLKMLLAAIDNVTRQGQFDVIVSAIGFDPWTMPSEDERMLALEVYRRARVVVSRQPVESHQRGAMWVIRMAMETAAAIGAEYLLHMAEDVLLHEGTAQRLLGHLQEHDYVGSHWGDERSLNTQVFGCRVSSFVDLASRRFVVDPVAMREICEHHMGNRVRDHNLRWKVLEDWNIASDERYFHSHHPTQFRAEVERRGGVWPVTPRRT